MDVICRLKWLAAIFFIVLSSSTYAQLPDYYHEPGYSDTRVAVDSYDADEVIDPFGGGLQLIYKDLIIPGNGGLDLVVYRRYQSLNLGVPTVGGDSNGPRHIDGIGWDIHFGRVWTSPIGGSTPSGCKTHQVSTNSNPVLELADGTQKVLADSRTSSYAFITKDQWIAKCNNGGLLVYSPEGVKYTFGFFKSIKGRNAYSVTKIEDVHGNAINFHYAPTSTHQNVILQKITTSDNRYLYFTYSNEKKADALLTKISTAAPGSGCAGSCVLTHKIVQYIYKKQPNHTIDYYLTDAIMPDNSRYKYTYYETRPYNDTAGVHSLFTVKNPGATTTKYYYGYKKFTYAINSFSTTTVKKKVVTATGGAKYGVWNFDYAVGSTYNTTTVTLPNANKIEYQHYSAISGSNGKVWRIGALAEKRSYTSTALTQKENYEWKTNIISDQNSVNQYDTGKIDGKTYAPILTKKTITLDSSSYSTSYSGHNKYGNPSVITETGNKSRITDLTYYINTSKWIVNRLKSESIRGYGSIVRNFNFSNGNLDSIKENNKVSSYQYYSNGDVLQLTDPRGIKTRYEQYKRGIPQKVTKAFQRSDQVIINRVVNNTGTVKSEKIDNKTTAFEYDALDRIKKITYPKGNPVTITWKNHSTINGASIYGIIQTITRGNYFKRTIYDSFGRSRSIETNGIKQTFDNDALGQMIFSSYPSSSAGEKYIYDVLGRIKRKTHADGKFILYDYLSNNKLKVTNEKDFPTITNYESYGEPTEKYSSRIQSPVSSASNMITTIARDLVGNIKSVSQGSKKRSYVYDSRKFIDYIDDPETGRTQVNFDNNGNLISKKVSNSGVTHFGYDGHNQLTNINYPNSTPDVTNVYYPTGDLKQTLKGGSKWSYVYDANGNLERETFNYGNRQYQIKRTYNTNDSLSTLQYPSGLSVNYQPDAFGRATAAGKFISNIQYHPDSQIKSLTYANGMKTTITQDARLRQKDIDVFGSSGRPVDLRYLYDNVGNTKSITNYKNSIYSYSLGYDRADRLTTVNGVNAIGYDLRGNILRKNIGSDNLAYSYNPNNDRLASVTHSGSPMMWFQYNVYGDITNNGLDTFAFDDASQLIAAPSKNMTFKYDGNGNRFFKKVGQSTTDLVHSINGQLLYEKGLTDQSQKDYIYVGNMLVAQRDQCGSVDSDNDGIPDCIEVRADLDPNNPADALIDSDNDGLTNLREYQLGTNIHNNDSDSDGMNDKFESDYGLNPLLDDAQLDKDSDGLKNIQEMQLGTQPNNSDTDGDGINDGDEVAAGSNPNFNPAVLIPIINMLLE